MELPTTEMGKAVGRTGVGGNSVKNTLYLRRRGGTNQRDQEATSEVEESESVVS